jgi:23S rRNA (guanosine2251-2'-O)-methyltransferase
MPRSPLRGQNHMADAKPSILYGINPVMEALKAGKRKCHKIVVKDKTTNSRIQSVSTLARSLHIKVEALPAKEFQQKYGAYAHQSIIGYFSSRKPIELNDLIRQAFQVTPLPTLALLDGIQDPQNLGAIIRAAETLGIQGIIIPERRSAQLTETVAKCSAGATECMPIACVNNLVQTLELLKKAGFWMVGVDAHGKVPCYEFQFDMPTALIIGGEEKGIRPLLRKKCDFTVHIPMQGKLDSLNAATACAVVFYEVMKQKNGGKP